MRGPALAALLALAACSSEGGGEPERPPDVVLIVVDTLRADHLGCYGYGRATSPNLDAFAAGGVVFETVVAPSSFTAPSMASLFTGRYPRFHSFGMRNAGYRLGEHETTLAETFLAAGYRTAGFVSNPVLRSQFGFDQGFEHYDQRMPQREAVRVAAERRARLVTDRAIEWLDAYEDERPLFLFVHYMDPHGPYEPPGRFAARFAPAGEDERGPRIPPPIEGDNGPKGRVPWYQSIPAEDGEHRLGDYVGRYDGEIACMDHHLGRLFDALEAGGRLERAVVAFTSDHGESMGENDFWFSHGHALTRDVTGIPLILRHPDLGPGRSATAVGLLDLFHTLAGVTGRAPAPPPDDVRDLVRLAADAGAPRALFSETASQLAVHADGHLLIGAILRADGEPDRFGPIGLHPLDDPFRRADDPPRHATLAGLAAGYLARPEARKAGVDESELDPGMQDALRALGYTGD